MYMYVFNSVTVILTYTTSGTWINPKESPKRCHSLTTCMYFVPQQGDIYTSLCNSVKAKLTYLTVSIEIHNSIVKETMCFTTRRMEHVWSLSNKRNIAIWNLMQQPQLEHWYFNVNKVVLEKNTNALGQQSSLHIYTCMYIHVYAIQHEMIPFLVLWWTVR